MEDGQDPVLGQSTLEKAILVKAYPDDSPFGEIPPRTKTPWTQSPSGQPTLRTAHRPLPVPPPPTTNCKTPRLGSTSCTPGRCAPSWPLWGRLLATQGPVVRGHHLSGHPDVQSSTQGTAWFSLPPKLPDANFPPTARVPASLLTWGAGGSGLGHARLRARIVVSSRDRPR